MRLFTYDSIPHTHEIIVDDENALFTFVLRPNLYEFVSRTLSGTNKRKEWNEKEYGLTNFIPPNATAWGYGEVLKASKSQPPNGWISWDCQLPFKASYRELYDIVGTIDDLTMVISIFDVPVDDNSSKQLMLIDGLTVKVPGKREAGSFGFKYSREVLDFATTIWGDDGYESKACEKIATCMKRIYAHLTGQLEMKDKYREFYINRHQDLPRLPTFNCPGDRTCALPASSYVDKDSGVSYNCHNVDNKFQQLALLSGAIKLANLARTA